jgi:hypothetical protein
MCLKQNYNANNEPKNPILSNSPKQSKPIIKTKFYDPNSYKFTQTRSFTTENSDPPRFCNPNCPRNCIQSKLSKELHTSSCRSTQVLQSKLSKELHTIQIVQGTSYKFTQTRSFTTENSDPPRFCNPNCPRNCIQSKS